MGKRKELCRLYQVPQLNPQLNSPVSVAGTAVIRHSRNSYEIRIILRRDRNVRLSSVTLLYRFSVKSLHTREEKSPFVKYVYAKPDINQKEYICLRKIISDSSASEGCTALICAAAVENGVTLLYHFEDYEDPETTEMDPAVLDADPVLKSLLTRYIPLPDQAPPAEPKQKPEQKPVSPQKIRRRLIRRRAFEMRQAFSWSS